MEAVQAVLGQVSASTLTRLGVVQPRVRSHLQRVYGTLACAFIASAAGAWLELSGAHINKTLVSFLTLLSVVYISFTHNRQHFSSSKGAPSMPRLLALLATGLGLGVNACNVLVLSSAVDATIPLKALLGTASVFVCFTCASLMAKRRSLLYLGGIASSMLTVLNLLRFAHLLGVGGSSMFDVEVFAGLAIFMLYTIADTQVIIERAGAGVYDAVDDALKLLIDTMGLLVKLAIALVRVQQQAYEPSERQRKRRQRGMSR